MEKNDLHQIIRNNMLQHPFVDNRDLVAVSPVREGDIDDGHGATGPLVLIGFSAGESVYRTTHTVAHHMEKKGVFCIHWPPLFPNIWLPECEYMQLDVTIRTDVSTEIPSLGGDEDEDDDDGVKMIFDNNDTDDQKQVYGNDHSYACVWNNHQQQQEQYQQQIETPSNNIDGVDEDWIIINDVNDNGFDTINIEDYE